MLYDNWLGDITDRFQRKLDAIKVEHNFDYGEEFEVALAIVLREILPLRFGVCRGFVVARDGTKAGDDIIIFDAQRFPVLRELERSDLSRKQQVPAEAVLAYIEAKHTLYLEGDEGQSLNKALEQVRAVKEIVRPRVRPRVLPNISLFRTPAAHLEASHTPLFRNPYYGAIWARNIEALKKIEPGWFPGQSIPALSRSDVIAAGPHLFLPGFPIHDGGRKAVMVCRFMTTATRYFLSEPASPWGTALAHLLWAMEWVSLGELPWDLMLAEQVSGPLRLVGSDDDDDHA
jgi:hypothetical protein